MRTYLYHIIMPRYITVSVRLRVLKMRFRGKTRYVEFSVDNVFDLMPLSDVLKNLYL